MTQGLAGGALELSGPVAKLVLLIPFVALTAVVWRAARAHRHHAEGQPLPAAQGVATVAKLPTEPPLEERIETATKLGDESLLAELYLLEAREASSAGDMSKATTLLRKSVTSAQRSGNTSVHADARLDLAEIARAAGDLTTACEHWQIARRVFHDLARKDRVAEADTLMLRHGCPTDWVLTDF